MGPPAADCLVGKPDPLFIQYMYVYGACPGTFRYALKELITDKVQTGYYDQVWKYQDRGGGRLTEKEHWQKSGQGWGHEQSCQAHYDTCQ